MKIRCASLILLLGTLSYAQYSGAKRVPSEWKKGFDSIREADAKNILSYLAGPELRGRGSLSPDYFAAAGYVAGELRRMGLNPAGEGGSYFQRFEYVRAIPIPEGTSLEASDGSVKLPYGPDFQASAIASGETRVRFAFVNVPEKADLTSFPWNQLRGRVVVQTSSSIRNLAYSERLNSQREELGIEGLVTVSQERLTSNAPFRAAGVVGMPDPRQGKAPSIRLSIGGARLLAEKLGATQFGAKDATQASLEAPPQEWLVKVRVTAETTPLVNVLAKLPGADAALSKEAIVYGSHLDHMGVSNDGTRFGADDNASGCTANLLLAQAFVRNPHKPKRSILFAFWAAEEIGTHGSYINRPAIPAANTVAYINMDMLGRDEETGPEIAENNRDVVYPGTVLTTSRDFYDRLMAANQFVRLRFKPDRTDRTHRSDTRNFYWKKVPTVKIFTGEHPDYHRTGDTIDKINWTKLISITRWLYMAGADLADRPDRPSWDPKPFAAPDFHILSGRATFSEKIALPSKARLSVGLYEAGGTNPLLEKIFRHAQGRTPFELLVPKAMLKEGTKYELRLQMKDGDRILFQTASGVAVPTTGWTRAQNIEIKLAGSVPIPRP